MKVLATDWEVLFIKTHIWQNDSYPTCTKNTEVQQQENKKSDFFFNGQLSEQISHQKRCTDGKQVCKKILNIICY